MKHWFKIIFLLMSLVVLNSCKISYSFTGASISPEVKTYSIYDFPNRARLINPTLSETFIEKLRNKFTRQTSLKYQEEGGDLTFEGSITGYDVQPMAVKADDESSMNRLTVKIKVTFTNNKDHEQDFESEFSAYSEFSSDELLTDVEDSLVEEILNEIIEDIYNKSVANW